MPKLHKEPRYITTIVVEGSGDFPFDMLRYDQCYPASERDSYLMGYGHKRQVTLTRSSVNAMPPTYRRWASFLWEVVSVDGLPVPLHLKG